VESYYPLIIPTKPYIKQYLQALYGNPVIFNSSNSLGIILVALLERPFKSHKRKDILSFRVFDKFDTPMHTYLPKSWLKNYKYGHTLSDQNIIALNKFFENQFEEDLYKACELARIYKVELKKAMEEFCWRHCIEIEEHISFEALKKKEYRFRIEQEKQKQKTLQKHPPPLSRQNLTLLRKIS